MISPHRVYKIFFNLHIRAGRFNFMGKLDIISGEPRPENQTGLF